MPRTCEYGNVSRGGEGVWKTSFNTQQEEVGAAFAVDRPVGLSASTGRSVGIDRSVCRPQAPDLFEFYIWKFPGFYFRLFRSFRLNFCLFCLLFVSCFNFPFASFCFFLFFFCCLCFLLVFGCTIYRPFAGRSAVAADGDRFNYLVLL